LILEVGIDIVDLVLTSQVCPMVSHLTEQVKRRVKSLNGIRQVEVRVLDEPWNWDYFVKQQNRSP
jgi:serine O-acetyltransferase